MIDLLAGGTEPSGRRYCLETDTIDGKAIFFGMIFTERYRKHSGRWHLAYMKVDIYHMTPYGAGWSPLEERST